MAHYRITLRARLKRGMFYWVAKVTADSEEEAVVAAEHLFLAESEDSADWSFEDYDVEQV